MVTGKLVSLRAVLLRRELWVPSHCSMSDTLQPNRPLPSRFLCQWDSPGKDTGVGCHALLQGIFPTQGWNSHLRHCRRSLYCWTSGEAQVLGSTWKWSIFHFFPFRSMRGFFFDIHCESKWKSVSCVWLFATV